MNKLPAEVYVDMPPFASAGMFSGNQTDNLYYDIEPQAWAHMRFSALAAALKFRSTFKDGMNRAQRRAQKGKR